MDKAGSSSVGFVHARNINKLEKDIKSVQKQMRRLEPKLTKTAKQYNHVLKEYEKGGEIVKAMVRKRDELVTEFLKLTKGKQGL
tara:strand:+ start:36 stop:287 length:252 start_codon:yes stop_codon:yes gene_type:complete